MRIFKSIFLLLFALLCRMALFASPIAAQESQQQKQEQKSQQNTQQNQYRDQAEDLLHNQQQRGSESYRGKIAEKNGKFYLEEEHTKSSYLLEGVWEAKRFLNKKVRITGSVDFDKDILHVISISLVP